VLKPKKNSFSTDFVITTSVDGHLKLWKKQETGIEFVKHYRAHITTIVGVSASADGELFASIADDGSAKVFDVVNFGAPPASFPPLSLLVLTTQTDMINMIKLGFTPKACCWVHKRGQAQGILAVYVSNPPFFCRLFVAAVAYERHQLGTEFGEYSIVRWSWGRKTVGDGGKAPSVPGPFDDGAFSGVPPTVLR
jgi:WD domain, G-beta repeat